MYIRDPYNKEFYKYIPWTSNFIARHLSYKNNQNWALRFMYMDIHHNIFYNSEKLETQMSNNRVGKLMMVRVVDGIPRGH